ncbi:hypothetical protein GIB67_032269 [Kingdonia uniflora]|uniref:Peptidase A1 domain-containing protein n=1 Tax=Kingdonia uniflora TaxID=39325 RepID=A0A7J7MXT0_9MAGN|nr:hypothetical protein GIB67_032269 [Kingdonia uniflora]
MHAHFAYTWFICTVKNFMTGNQIVFDREKLVLDWKQSNCDSDQASTTISTTPSKVAYPATAIGEATEETGNIFHPLAGTSCLK